jgi:hypothetical protein
MSLMDEALKLETEKLIRSWMRHDEPFLRDYLVVDVEDPRINVQSILSRHFVLATLFGNRFAELMLHELRFAGAMNWLVQLAKRGGGEEERLAVLHALNLGADNAEGVAIPHFLIHTFRALSAGDGKLALPNYVEEFLNCEPESTRKRDGGGEFDTFLSLWCTVLAGESAPPISVLEPACGSANDYRYLEAYGIARLVDYTGFDLCEKNIANARALLLKRTSKSATCLKLRRRTGPSICASCTICWSISRWLVWSAQSRNCVA